MYAMPQKDLMRRSSLSNLLGSLGSELVTDEDDDEEELDDELLDFFFASVTPTATPAAMRTTSPMSEPMTCAPPNAKVSSEREWVVCRWGALAVRYARAGTAAALLLPPPRRTSQDVRLLAASRAEGWLE